MSKYRIPKIEEFVGGFKYQVSHTHRIHIMNFNDPSKDIIGEDYTTWFDKVVPNLDPIEYPYTIKDEDGTTWTFMNGCDYDDPLDNIKRMLPHGYIRTEDE